MKINVEDALKVVSENFVGKIAHSGVKTMTNVKIAKMDVPKTNAIKFAII